MKLRDFVDVDASIYELRSAEKEGVIEELLERLLTRQASLKQQRGSIVEALIRREELGTTGIGRGIAVPHTKHAAVKKLMAIVGRSAPGVDFASLDGEPVHIFFLLLSPLEEPGLHLKALEHISYLLRDDRFCRFLRTTRSREEMIELLDKAEEEILSETE